MLFRSWGGEAPSRGRARAADDFGVHPRGLHDVGERDQPLRLGRALQEGNVHGGGGAAPSLAGLLVLLL